MGLLFFCVCQFGSCRSRVDFLSYLCTRIQVETATSHPPTPAKCLDMYGKCRERTREFEALSFFINQFSTPMIVSMNRQQGRNPVINALCATLVERGYLITIYDSRFRVDVPNWHCFLSCAWHGYALCCRQSHGDAMRMRYLVDLPEHNRHGWFQLVGHDGEEEVGIRYGSV